MYLLIYVFVDIHICIYIYIYIYMYTHIYTNGTAGRVHAPMCLSFGGELGVSEHIACRAAGSVKSVWIVRTHNVHCSC